MVRSVAARAARVAVLVVVGVVGSMVAVAGAAAAWRAMHANTGRPVTVPSAPSARPTDLTPTRPAATPTPPAATSTHATSNGAGESTEPATWCVPGGHGARPPGNDDPRYIDPVGTRRAVMIFVDFPNATAAKAPAGYRTTDAYSRFFLPAGPDWFAVSSFNRFTLDVTPIDRWLRMSKKDTAYEFVRNLPYDRHEAYIAEAVRLADPYVDFSGYDLVYIVPPINATAITFSPAFVGGSWSKVRADGKTIGLAVTFGQDMWIFGPKVLNHETGHAIGLPDLYEYAPGEAIDQYVGGWDLQGDISGNAPDYFAWHKWSNGWIDSDQVRCVTRPGTTTQRLTPIETAGGVKLVLINIGDNKVYAVENRRAVGNDTAACSTGVLVYLIDANRASGNGPIRVVDSSPGKVTYGPGCRDLDVSTYKVGGAYKNRAAHLTIRVTGQTGDTSTVEVTLTG